MPRSIDKNEVDISKLFEWKREVTINTYNGEVKVYMRLAGDAEIGRAKVYALRRSAEFRKKLRDLESEERLAYIPDMNSVVEDELVNGILSLLLKDITSDAYNTIKVPLPAELPSDATLEQQEEHQREIDEYPMRRDFEIRKYMEEKLVKEEAKYKKMSKEQLAKTYETMVINQLCEVEMLTAFKEMITFFSLYTNDKYNVRIFDDIEEFRNLPTQAKLELIQAYQNLDIDGEVLKKSLEVTQ